jgi:Cation efflux family
MACCNGSSCSDAARSDALNSPKWRRALWIALFINAAFFVAEIVTGVAAGSTALQADALDFFGDAANYAISLGVAGAALAWRARAAVAKGHLDCLGCGANFRNGRDEALHILRARLTERGRRPRFRAPSCL